MLGSGEIIVILCIVMLLFGGKKLPEFARSLGKGIREFKSACNGLDGEEDSHTTRTGSTSTPSSTLDVTPESTDTTTSQQTKH